MQIARLHGLLEQRRIENESKALILVSGFWKAASASPAGGDLARAIYMGESTERLREREVRTCVNRCVQPSSCSDSGERESVESTAHSFLGVT